MLLKKLNVTDKAVSRWERGVGFPDITTLEPLASTLGVSVLELMKQEQTVEEEFTVIEGAFRKHVISVNDDAFNSLPDAMKQHVENGGKLWAVERLDDEQLVISTKPSAEAITHIMQLSDTSDFSQKLRITSFGDVPAVFMKHVNNGGSLYVIGTRKDGKICIADHKDGSGTSIMANSITRAEWIEEQISGDYCTLRICIRACINIIRNQNLSDNIRIDAAHRLYDYLVYCLSKKELDEYTATYRNKNSDLITGYEPNAICEFYNQMLKAYPYVSDTVERMHMKRRFQIYCEIADAMTDWLNVINNSSDEHEKKQAEKLLHNYLNDCLGRNGMNSMTWIFKEKQTDDVIGYEMDAVTEFVTLLSTVFHFNTGPLYKLPDA